MNIGNINISRCMIYDKECQMELIMSYDEDAYDKYDIC